MARSPMMTHPVRLHISLEKKTVSKLRKIARRRAKSLTEIVRDLAESFAAGRLSWRSEEPLSQVVQRIRALRARSASVPDRSEHLVRSLRDSRA